MAATDWSRRAGAASRFGTGPERRSRPRTYTLTAKPDTEEKFMAAKKSTGRAKSSRPAKRPALPKSPEARAAHGEIQQGLRHLGKSLGEIQRGLRAAERQIEADARKRIAALRKEGRAQLVALNARSREVAASLKRAVPLAETSWEDLKRTADAILSDARAAAASFASRIRDAITR
jgi:hypothetical protein